MAKTTKMARRIQRSSPLPDDRLSAATTGDALGCTTLQLGGWVNNNNCNQQQLQQLMH
jgi:hypothetical protein